MVNDLGCAADISQRCDLGVGALRIDARPALFLLGMAALLACGGSGQTDGSQSFALALPPGSEVRVGAGETSYVKLMAVGRGSTDVAFGIDGGPPFVTLAGDVLTIAPPLPERSAAFDVTVTARTSGASDSKTLHLVIERRQNDSPRLLAVFNDDRSFPVSDTCFVDDVTGLWCTPTDVGSCLGSVTLHADLLDDANELDPVQVEVELVPDGVPFTGTATHRSAVLSDYRPEPGGGGVHTDVPITGVEQYRVYRAAVRAVDDLGGTTDWGRLPDPFTCAPFALSAAYSRSVMPGQRICIDVSVQGSAPGPVEMTVTGLPTWATFSGTRIEGTVPSDVPVFTRISMLATATSGGHTVTQRYTVLVTNLAADACMP